MTHLLRDIVIITLAWTKHNTKSSNHLGLGSTKEVKLC